MARSFAEAEGLALGLGEESCRVYVQRKLQNMNTLSYDARVNNSL